MPLPLFSEEFSYFNEISLKNSAKIKSLKYFYIKKNILITYSLLLFGTNFIWKSFVGTKFKRLYSYLQDGARTGAGATVKSHSKPESGPDRSKTGWFLLWNGVILIEEQMWKNTYILFTL